MSVIPIYLDTEMKPGYGGDWEVEQLGLYDPMRTKGSRKCWKIRTNPNDDQTPTFPVVFHKAVSWIEEYKDKKDTILLIGHNLRAADIKILKETCTRFTIPWPGHWQTFDTLPLFRRVLPTRNHKLQYIRHMTGVRPWEPHQADADAKGLYKTLSKICNAKEVFELCHHEATSLDEVAGKILAERKVIPIFYDLTMSGYLKKDKLEKHPYPRILKIDAYCPYRSDNQRFSTLINPEERVEIDPEFSEGIEEEDLLDQPGFKKAVSCFRKWSQSCLEGNLVNRVAYVAYSNFKRNNKILDLESEIHFGCKFNDVIFGNEDCLYKNVVHFDLSYFKSCLVQGFPLDPIWEGGRDRVFDEVLDYFQILEEGDHLDKTYRLYEAMLGDADRNEVSNALLQKPNIKAVADVVKPHFVPRPSIPFPIYCDTETTGLPPRKGENKPWPRIVQVAGFAPLKEEGDQWFNSYVNPGIKIPEESTETHGIIDADVKNHGDWGQVGNAFYRWALHGLKPFIKPIFIFHNANFDWYVMRRENERMNVNVRLDATFFCTFQMSRSLLKGRTGHSLEDLAKRFNITHDEAHDAKGDVSTTYKVAMKLIEDRMSEKEFYEAILERENPRSAKEVVEKLRKNDSSQAATLVSITSEKTVRSKRGHEEGASTQAAPQKKARTQGLRRSQRKRKPRFV